MNKPKQHALPKRDMTLAGGANFRTEFHGDKPVKAADIGFSDWKLEPAEFCELVQEQLAYRALYLKRAGSTLDEPLFRTIEWIPLDITITGKVSLFSNLGSDELDLGVCEISRLKFRCRPGGLTEFKGLLQTKPVLDKRIVDLIDRLGDNVQMSVNYEHGEEQQELPMGATIIAATQNGASADAGEGEPAASEDPPKTDIADIGPKTREEIAKHAERVKGRKGATTPGAH